MYVLPVPVKAAHGLEHPLAIGTSPGLHRFLLFTFAPRLGPSRARACARVESRVSRARTRVRQPRAKPAFILPHTGLPQDEDGCQELSARIAGQSIGANLRHPTWGVLTNDRRRRTATGQMTGGL